MSIGCCSLDLKDMEGVPFQCTEKNSQMRGVVVLIPIFLPDLSQIIHRMKILTETFPESGEARLGMSGIAGVE